MTRPIVARIAALALCLLAVPLAAEAQPAKPLPRVAVLIPGSPPAPPGGVLDQFRQGLKELGWEDGRNIRLDILWDDLDMARAQENVAKAVREQVDVILAGGTPTALAARRLTSTIPVIFAVSADPVADGLVASFSRPGANLTGLSIMTPESTEKRLQLLKAAIPNLARVALLVDTSLVRWPNDLKEHEAVARNAGLALVPIKVGGPGEIDAAFRSAKQENAQAVVLMQSAVFAIHGARVAQAASANRMPTIAGSGDGQYAQVGGLMNYGASLAECWRRSARYVHRVLQGAKPADMPVEQPLRFELVVNQKTAQALGITLPPALLLQADRVIR